MAKVFEMEEFKLFGKVWEAIPRSRLAGGKFTAAAVCLRKPYADFLLSGLNQMIDEGIRGIYFDNRGIHACMNEYSGCGYVDKNGERKEKSSKTS